MILLCLLLFNIYRRHFDGEEEAQTVSRRANTCLFLYLLHDLYCNVFFNNSQNDLLFGVNGDAENTFGLCYRAALMIVAPVEPSLRAISTTSAEKPALTIIYKAFNSFMIIKFLSEC